MTNNPVDFVVLREDESICRLNPFRILKSIKELRDDFEKQEFKSNIESICILGELLDKCEDAALVSILERS